MPQYLTKIRGLEMEKCRNPLILKSEMEELNLTGQMRVETTAPL